MGRRTRKRVGVIIVDEFGGMDICKGRDMCRRGREGGG